MVRVLKIALPSAPDVSIDENDQVHIKDGVVIGEDGREVEIERIVSVREALVYAERVRRVVAEWQGRQR